MKPILIFTPFFVCFVALVTDPGSAYPRLDAAFAADLLVETVSALRS